MVIAGVILVPIFTQDLADAKSTRKIHFTQTLLSSHDPGQGHDRHQMALILSPQAGTIYDGSITFTADKPIQIAVLHEINADESKGQPIWTIDGKTIYAFSLIDTSRKSGSVEFTGAAVALHSSNPESFTSTVSVDGWIRGGAIEFVTQAIDVTPEPPSVELLKSRVSVTIPMHMGLYEGNQTLYIITDSSDAKLAQSISEKQQWRVELAPPLSTAPDSVLGEIYFFTNGVHGDGLYGFQNEIFSDTPNQYEQYSALRKVINITWKLGQNSNVLNSVDDVAQAKKNGRIEIKETDIVLNTPQIIWHDGQMPIRDSGLADDTSYGGSQILDIDTESVTVTFVAHRGWGPDGKTIYYIITDATPTAPADLMGVIDTPSSTKLVSDSIVSDLYQFKNGLTGSGALGFQPQITSVRLDNQTYSPIRQVSIVEWIDTENVMLLETIDDIETAKSDKRIIVSIARPTQDIHIINSPIIDPYQNSKDKLSPPTSDE